MATLATSRKDLTQAMRKVEGKSPNDDAFSEANSAVLVLEKTLATMNVKDSALTAQVADGRQALSANRALFQSVEHRYGVGAGVIAGIWGLESGFGAITGDFRDRKSVV